MGAQHLSIKTRQEERGDGEGQGFLHQRLLKLEIEKIIKTRQEERGEEKIIKTRQETGGPKRISRENYGSTESGSAAPQYKNKTGGEG